MPSRGRQRIAKDAADWHAKMLQPESEAQVATFEAWLDADPMHARAYAEQEALTGGGSKLPRRLLTDAPPTATPLWLRPSLAGVAAALLLIATGLWLGSGSTEPAYAAITNPGAAVRTVRLQDGSTVILDAETELAVSFSDHARAIEMRKGRARFTIASDPARPLTVSDAERQTTASGTHFDVALARNGLLVRAISQDVVVAPGRAGGGRTQNLALRAGQAVLMRPGGFERASVDPFDARWPAARLSFADEPLARILAVANREGRPTIRVTDPAVGRLRVTGVLDLRDTQPLARKLAATLDLRIEHEPGAIILSR